MVYMLPYPVSSLVALKQGDRFTFQLSFNYEFVTKKKKTP
jgi:hypothetical protein